jgi:hypothetical protein
VNVPVRGYHAEILAQRAPQTEIQRYTTSIGDLSTGFRDEQRTGCMVLVGGSVRVIQNHKKTQKIKNQNQTHPDLFPVPLSGDGQPQQDATLAPRQGRVLRLAVHPHGRRGEPEPLGDVAGEVVRRVCGLAGLEQRERGERGGLELEGLGGALGVTEWTLQGVGGVRRRREIRREGSMEWTNTPARHPGP